MSGRPHDGGTMGAGPGRRLHATGTTGAGPSGRQDSSGTGPTELGTTGRPPAHLGRMDTSLAHTTIRYREVNSGVQVVRVR